jgi:hypothetical protein
LIGASSTPRLLGSNSGVSGILGRPVKPGDDTEWMFDILDPAAALRKFVACK